MQRCGWFRLTVGYSYYCNHSYSTWTNYGTLRLLYAQVIYVVRIRNNSIIVCTGITRVQLTVELELTRYCLFTVAAEFWITFNPYCTVPDCTVEGLIYKPAHFGLGWHSKGENSCLGLKTSFESDFATTTSLETLYSSKNELKDRI